MLDITTHLPLYSFQWACLIYWWRIVGWAVTSWKPVQRCESSARFTPWVDGWLNSAWGRRNRRGLHTLHVKSALGDGWLPLGLWWERDLLLYAIQLDCAARALVLAECAPSNKTLLPTQLSLFYAEVATSAAHCSSSEQCSRARMHARMQRLRNKGGLIAAAKLCEGLEIQKIRSTRLVLFMVASVNHDQSIRD